VTDSRTSSLDLQDPSVDPFAVAVAAADVIAERSGSTRHDVALVLGSGWGQTGDLIGRTVATIDNADVPGFAKAAVAGHSGVIRSVAIGDTDRRALVYGTRTHFYEGRGVRSVVHAVRTAAAAGCRTIVLTNGCGGLNPAWTPGTPVLIRDHLNLTAASPIEGANFVDLTDLYSHRLRDLARSVDPDLDQGVYVQFRGPHYETPAEVRMAKILGGDLVGMSTTLEAIAARQSGMEVLGISLVTNLAAGIPPQAGGAPNTARPLSHDEVLDAGRAAAERCGHLLAAIVAMIEIPR
jgi:purine-nucleoside phosphorylase